jgi:LPS sulfotransferase NodH
MDQVLPSSSQRLLRLYSAMEVAYGHLRRAGDLEQQAVSLLKEAEATHRRVEASRSPTSAPRLDADAARTAGLG